ncbi:MAG: hypothetical protein AB8B83_08780 [Bdellovibrionales bacterium]
MLTEANQNYLRKKFAAYTDPDNKKALKSIALVGGVPSLGCLNSWSLSKAPDEETGAIESESSGLINADEDLLEEALKTLKRLGYTVASDFDVTIVNINEEFGGIDYMDPESQDGFDVSIFCFIARIKREKNRTQNALNTYLKNSAYESKNRHSWLKAAIHRGSKVLVTHGTSDMEVTAKDFKGGWFYNRSPYRLKHSEHLPFHGASAHQDAQLQVMCHRDL